VRNNFEKPMTLQQIQGSIKRLRELGDDRPQGLLPFEKEELRRLEKELTKRSNKHRRVVMPELKDSLSSYCLAIRQHPNIGNNEDDADHILETIRDDLKALLLCPDCRYVIRERLSGKY